MLINKKETQSWVGKEVGRDVEDLGWICSTYFFLKKEMCKKGDSREQSSF